MRNRQIIGIAGEDLRPGELVVRRSRGLLFRADPAESRPQMAQVPADGFYWAREKKPYNRIWLVVEVENGRVWVIGDDGWWSPEDFEWGEKLTPPE